MTFPHKDSPLIMGILNVTPDSFSDGGQFDETQPAVKHALAMMYEGADVIDVGGESTRPGSKRIDAEQQISRVNETIKSIREIALINRIRFFLSILKSDLLALDLIFSE